MFGFKKKEQKPLWIMGKEVMEIIRSDYDGGMSFTLIEFHYQEGVYLMGSCVVPPEAEERKERIRYSSSLRSFSRMPVSTASEFLNWKNL